MLPINGSLVLGVISLTYIRPIDLCVLCVFVVRSSRSLARLYFRTHFTHQTLREPIN
ncbi:Similarity (fragment) [Microcystis aeruginosa PCC 9432]|uniref:Similarity n=2 Tax=Microcystis aeruginosa TaxID=1126 RepID=A0A831EHX0_MICAE